MEARKTSWIPFNHPFRTGVETTHIEQAIENVHLSSGGAFTERCEEWLQASSDSERAILTHSGTGALELAALLVGGERGDEVIMPSFTFPTTASAFARRGLVPVFVDIEPESLTIDPVQVEAALSEKTVAVVPVHYGGVGCDMDALRALAGSQSARIVEDAAQALLATRDGKPLGGSGDLAAISFHETKNLTCGEGGALLVNDPDLVDRAQILRDKGTDRVRFERGEVDKYTWVDLGSSFAMSEVSAAFLWAQLEDAKAITESRHRAWDAYHDGLADLEARGRARRPVVPPSCEHNAHTYYLLLAEGTDRASVLAALNASGVNAVFHYVPLHSSPAGQAYGRAAGDLAVTDDVSDRLIRLPLWADMPPADVDRVVETVIRVLG